MNNNKFCYCSYHPKKYSNFTLGTMSLTVSSFNPEGFGDTVGHYPTRTVQNIDIL